MQDRVVVKRESSEKVSKGGIILPDVSETKSFKGKVVAVGPGKRDEDGELVPMGVKVGDLVLFNSKWNDMGDDYQNTGVNWPEDVHVIQEADIIGVYA
jgi:chaperonin GroES